MAFKTTDCVYFAKPQTLAAALTEAGVIAALDYLPQSGRDIVPVTATIALDEHQHIAQLQDDQVVANLDAGEVLGQIAEDLQASVWAPTLQLARDFDVPSAPADAKLSESITAVVTPAPLSSLPLHAEVLGNTLYVLDLGDRRVVITRGREDQHYGFYGWDDESLPALELSHSKLERLAVLQTTDAVATWHSWDLQSEVVPSDKQDLAAVKELASQLFTRREDAQGFAEYAGCDVATMETVLASDPKIGIGEFLQLMGLPEILADVLAGEVDPADIPGVHIFQAGSIPKAIGAAVKLYVNEEYPPAAREALWLSFGRLYLAKRGLRLAVAAAESGLAAWLLTSAKRRGSTWRGVAAALLAVDAIANIVIPQSVLRYIGLDEPDVE